MAGRKLEQGPTGETVAANVRRFRERKNLTYTQVSARLASIGRHIPPLAVRRLEEGERRADVDDLTSLAAALDVSPAALLMPDAKDEDDVVQVSGGPSPLPAWRAWDWFISAGPLGTERGGPEGPGAEQRIRFHLDNKPRWAQSMFEQLFGTDALALRASLDRYIRAGEPERNRRGDD